MAHAISRIFATKADADAAIRDLGENGFDSEKIFVVHPPDGALASGSPAIVDEIADKIAKGYILKRVAKVYAKHVAQGAVFVTVYAEFGSGRRAEVLLDRHDPIDPGLAPLTPPRAKYDEATPFSSTFRLPVLSSGATPCSNVMGLPAILEKGGPVLSAWERYSTVFHAPAPLSHLLGLPVMTASGEPTSSSFGLPAVTASGEPISSALGLPTLTARGAPTIGLPALTANGAPTIGLPAVTARGAPTSLGLPLLW